MIDAEKRGCRGLVPPGESLAGRERDDLEKVAIRIAEVEGTDPTGVRVPVRKALRSGGRVLDAVILQHGVCLVDVAHDNGDVLERAIVCPDIRWNRPALRRQKLRQLNFFRAEPQRHYSPAGAKHA